MAHNHAVIYNPAFRQRDPNDEDGYEVRCDLSKEFESSFPVKHFGTYEEFEEQLKKFQTKTKSIYIKRNACRWPPDALEKQHLVYRRLKIECVHYGQRKRNKPNKPNIKFPTFDDFASRLEEFQRETGCFYSRRSTVVWPPDAYGKEHLKYNFKNKGYVEILSYEMRHNHPPSLEASALGSGQLDEVDTGYTSWCVRPREEPREDGVAFAVRNDVVRRLSYLAQCSTTIFAAYEDIQEGQLVVLFLFHRELNVLEDDVEMFLECQHLIPFDDDKGIIHMPGPEFRFVVLEDQRLLRLQDHLGDESRIVKDGEHI
ncbi:zinc ion binding [Sparganum proliferum]